jgi:hypothetical protein
VWRCTSSAWVASSQTTLSSAERDADIQDLLELLPGCIEYHRTAQGLPKPHRITRPAHERIVCRSHNRGYREHCADLYRRSIQCQFQISKLRALAFIILGIILCSLVR